MVLLRELRLVHCVGQKVVHPFIIGGNAEMHPVGAGGGRKTAGFVLDGFGDIDEIRSFFGGKAQKGIV